ncbi:MAG: PilZ domain-containing protein [Chloroflexi bacterium]|nr:PilZ domain-containing protein [Chloroflexota bacterium]MBI3339382.1 PilZ domain-containing protein [Chloroflexota bacterium]
MAERRKTKRRYLLYYGRVYDQTAQKLLGYLVDITERGFMLLSEEPMPVGRIRELKLEVTTDIAKGPYINFTAKSLWCEPDLDPSRYNIGFEIVKIEQEDIQIIREIIAAYGFRDN